MLVPRQQQPYYQASSPTPQEKPEPSRAHQTPLAPVFPPSLCYNCFQTLVHHPSTSASPYHHAHQPAPAYSFPPRKSIQYTRNAVWMQLARAIDRSIVHGTEELQSAVLCSAAAAAAATPAAACLLLLSLSLSLSLPLPPFLLPPLSLSLSLSLHWRMHNVPRFCPWILMTSVSVLLRSRRRSVTSSSADQRGAPKTKNFLLHAFTLLQYPSNRTTSCAILSYSGSSHEPNGFRPRLPCVSLS